MVKMGLKELDSSEKRWSHPPKKKWIYDYLADDEETTEDVVREESDKREVVYRRTIETYSRTTPITASPTTTTTQHHYHRHHHHNHHNSNHGINVLANSPPPPPPPARTTPSSPAHAISPPVVGVTRSTGTLGVSTVQIHQQQTSPRTSVSYPGSPASSPPRVVLPPRGSSSPLGLLSALSQDSSSPPMGGASSDPGLSRLPHESLHPHIHNGIRHNGITKSLSLSPPHNFTHHGVYSPEDNSFKEDKKRSGSTPSREVHNKLEKNRRAHLKECFETLRRQLPSMDDKKISNQTILKAAHRHIQNLKRKEREFEHEMERLAREKIAHQQKLSALKKELSARWDHIDFNTLLPDMASLEQHRDKETKSTTTASEQPDLDDDAPRIDANNGHHSSGALVAPCSLSPRLSTNQAQGTSSFTTIASSSKSMGATGLGSLREHFTDSNQPLNLSTSIVDTAKLSPSGQTLVTQSLSPHQNGEWGTRQASPHYTQASYHASANKEEETWSATVVTSVTPTTTGDTITTVHSEHHLPIVGSAGGINLSAQLVAGGMQLNGAPGGLLGQPAIQVITPEGYKLLPADHAPNGAKPLTITLAHPAEGLERADNADDVKSSPGAMMLALNKNGVSALHLAVPTPPRSLPHSQGTNGTVTTVPLNLSVGGTATVKVTSAATSSLIPSYIPITHANGITQLVPGLGTSVGTLVSSIGTPLMAPLVVSQPQRPVPGSATTAGSKGLKATVAGSTNSMPLVTAQYASSLAGGLVKPVVVVSAPTAVAGMVTGAPAGASGKP
ncbi:uncharacterized protein Mnt isoform X2 [Palaemon carinicauda]|uniref:uncharacterized protein Mnt isoform X2 n=1 Tax=Palaemon carinicauda TaxID=392227 RepID=UPI0035B61B28